MPPDAFLTFRAATFAGFRAGLSAGLSVWLML
jgi:hypothetical protein